MIRFFNDIKGSVSVFLLLVMIPMYSFAFAIAQAAAYSDSKAKLSGALDLLGNTVLSGYNVTLKEKYGLLSVSESSDALSQNLSLDLTQMMNNASEAEVLFYADSGLCNTSVLREIIKTSMKYEAPYKWATLVTKRFSIFEEADKIKKVLDKSKDFYKALSSVKDSYQKVYSSIKEINIDANHNDLAKQLDSLSEFVPELKNNAKYIQEAVTAYKSATDEIKSEEIKNVMNNDVPFLSVPDEDDIAEFEKCINSDMAQLNTSEAADEEAEKDSGPSELSFTKTNLYNYLVSSFGIYSSGDEKSTLKSDLEEISSADIESVLSDVKNVCITELISDDIYTDLLGSASDEKSSFKYGAFSAVAENCFEAEFISSRFNNLVSHSEGDIFVGEQEYILFGNRNTRTNISFFLDSVFGLRLILNSIYALTNSNMRQAALGGAAAVAGFTGLGVPVVQNLILISWAAAESIVDVVSLCKGLSVPIYKNSSTWNLSLNGIQEVLKSGVENAASITVDNVFSAIEDFSQDKVGELKSRTLQYAEQTGRAAVESITNSIIVPIENRIFGLISGVRFTCTQADIEKILFEAADMIDADSAGVQKAKELFKEYCAPELAGIIHANLPDLFSGKDDLETQARQKVSSSIDKSYAELFAQLSKFTDDLESEFNKKINARLEEGKENIKEDLREIIKEYSEKADEFSITGKSQNKSTLVVSSGFGMTYGDYLNLMIFTALNSVKSNNSMLKRCAVVMQINCSGEDETFDIRKCHKSVSLKVKSEIGRYSLEKERVFTY